MASLDLDWTRDGRQAAYLRLPNSTNASAWQSVQIPIFLLRNGSGPCSFLLGGSHGDEYEGVVALSRLVHRVDPRDMRGTLVVAPAINMPAVLAGTRLSPLDGLNLNREFPGDPRGSVTQRLADFIIRELVPRADNVFDIHSGGRSLRFEPCVFLHAQPDPARTRTFLDAAASFGASLVVVVREPYASVMIDDVVERAGKVMLSSELGGSAIVTRHTAELSFQGLVRLLVHLGHFDSRSSATSGLSPARTSRVVQVPDESYQIYADDTGVFEPWIDLGDPVQTGASIGTIHHLHVLDSPPTPVIATRSGLLLCLHGQGLVHRGDTLCVLASDFVS